jgi:hypothetical protein
MPLQVRPCDEVGDILVLLLVVVPVTMIDVGVLEIVLVFAVLENELDDRIEVENVDGIDVDTLEKVPDTVAVLPDVVEFLEVVPAEELGPVPVEELDSVPVAVLDPDPVPVEVDPVPAEELDPNAVELLKVATMEVVEPVGVAVGPDVIVCDGDAETLPDDVAVPSNVVKVYDTYAPPSATQPIPTPSPVFVRWHTEGLAVDVEFDVPVISQPVRGVQVELVVHSDADADEEGHTVDVVQSGTVTLFEQVDVVDEPVELVVPPEVVAALSEAVVVAFDVVPSILLGD